MAPNKFNQMVVLATLPSLCSSVASTPDQKGEFCTELQAAKLCSGGGGGGDFTGNLGSAGNSSDDTSEEDEDLEPTRNSDQNKIRIIKQDLEGTTVVEYDSESPLKCPSPGLSNDFQQMNTTDDSQFGKLRGWRHAKPYQSGGRSQFLPYQNSKSEHVSKVETGNNTFTANLILYVTSIMDLTKFHLFECCNDARTLSRVTVIMTKNNQLYKFLEVFAHSASCRQTNCSNTCRMFNRIRNHVSTTNHPCAVMHVYSQLLRMHVDTCRMENCGLITCKSMLAMRKVNGHQVLPNNFAQIEQAINISRKNVTNGSLNNEIKDTNQETMITLPIKDEIKDNGSMYINNNGLNHNEQTCGVSNISNNLMLNLEGAGNLIAQVPIKEEQLDEFPVGQKRDQRGPATVQD